MKLHTQILLILLAISGAAIPVKAQLDPLGAQYYTNQYIANPALAGDTTGIKINGVYRQLWNNVPGAPSTQNLTADYGFKKVGVGININNESAGLLKQTRVVGTYAYHIPMKDPKQQLHFGVSFGFSNQRLETSDVDGDEGDPSVGMYNNRKTYLDGDFGIAYTSNRFSIQAAVPNLKNFFKKETLNQAEVNTFYTAVSYRFSLYEGDNGILLEPKMAYRGIQNFDNIWDAGAQLSMVDRQIMISTIYHSTHSTTFGLGMDFRRKYLFTAMYTSQTAALAGYTNGSFEVNLRITVGK
ncbi:PorP/SprF family type IX secretion system membrane protein [Pedobacter metabolipauper]|uniref:Type IX secretion system PorP/SprF family membrane protein n=1 Tax=Pedobacter metabolipauper TaxID=425513 RepID=A0A4R6SZQ1_9SPHI|nr:PorP/SprF family type IX secretion system membrane protein [Pedobacter metabolipauper]TDQ11545.1 type IX secretion system PorP/SprF family membrane protein [Pedobacter metabolipauper]